MRNLLGTFRSVPSIAALIVLVLILFAAIFGEPLFGDAARNPDVLNAELGPSLAQPFGTDQLGRDVFARTVVSAGPTLLRALLSGLGAAAVGTVLGVAISLQRGRPRLQSLAQRVLETSLAFPALLTAIFVTAVLGSSGSAATIGIGLALIPGLARLAQSMSASIVERDFVRAAEQLGLRRPKILFREVVPNLAETMVTAAASATALALIAVSALSFLQLGVQAPDFDWGTVLAAGLSRIYSAPWAALGPAAFITVTGASIAYLADAIGRRANRRAVIAATGPSARPEAVTGDDDIVLDVRGLSVSFATPMGEVTPVRGVDLTVRRGEIVGIVGESGSGKSVTSMAIAELLPPNARVRADRWTMVAPAEGEPADAASRRRWMAQRIGVVFQDAMTSLNPAMRVGRQISESARVHRGLGRSEAQALAVERLGEVRVAAPELRVGQFPHEFSGGMRQRVVIATGMINHPDLLIADEPTTALDVTVQDEVLALLRHLNRQDGSSIVFISHDLAVVSELCDRVLVMYGGTIVEELPADQLAEPQHPYTRALLAASPTLDTVQHLAAIPGNPPDPAMYPPGCPFAPRCPHVSDRCAEPVSLVSVGTGHRVACVLAADDRADSSDVEVPA